MALSAAFAAVSGATLLLWYVTVRPDLADLVRRFVPDWPFWPPCTCRVRVLHREWERVKTRRTAAWCSVRSTRRGFTAPAALVLQAVAFGALHFRAGFPRGIVGVGLTFACGLVLGELRRRAGGFGPFGEPRVWGSTTVRLRRSSIERSEAFGFGWDR